MQQKILQKYYLKVQFQYYPYEEHDIIVEVVGLSGGKHLQEVLKYQLRYDVKQFHQG